MTTPKPSSPSDQTRAIADFAFGSQTHVADASRPLAWLSAEELNIDLSDPAQRRFGDYELIERIGQGGMGVVYRARQHGLERDVAIKLLAAGPWASEEFVARFRREAKSAARMQHPNIVEIYEFGHREGLNYFSMRLIEGLSLAQRLAKNGPMPAKDAAKLLRTLAEAMDYAHRLGVLHLDLKPANVLIGQNGEPLIADFGLARRIDAGHEGGNDEISGTPSYMAPEQALLESHPLSASTDIYGLGAVLYEMLTGRPPFQAADAQATLERVIAEPPTPPRKLRKDIPPELEAICLKCLEKEPRERYSSARDLADDLARFLDGRAVSVLQLNSMQRLGRWVRREPQLASAVGVAILALAIGITATTLQWRRANQTLAGAEYLEVAMVLPNAADDSIQTLLEQIHNNLSDASRYRIAKELGDSPSAGRWLVAGLIGETLRPPDNIQVGDAQIRRAVVAMPSDPFALMVAITYCSEKTQWSFQEKYYSTVTCPIPDAPMRLTRVDPDNLFGWEALIDPPNLDWKQYDQLTAEVRKDGPVRTRILALISRAARATRWNDGYGKMMQAKALAYDASFVPLVRQQLASPLNKRTPFQLSYAGVPDEIASWQEPYSMAWEGGMYSQHAVLARICDTSTPEPAIRADCIRIGHTMADAQGVVYINNFGWRMLRRLEKGTAVEKEMIERRRSYLWMQEKDSWSQDIDPVQAGRDYVRDWAKVGELEADFLKLDRLGIPRNPPPEWQPKYASLLELPEERK